MAQLIVPVGLHTTCETRNIATYDDSLTLAAQAGLLEPTKKLFFSNPSGLNGMNARKALCLAAEENHLPIVKLFVEARVDLNTPLWQSKTPLYLACERGHFETADYLAHRFEADVNVPCDKSNKTALYIAAENNHPQVVASLI